MAILIIYLTLNDRTSSSSKISFIFTSLIQCSYCLWEMERES
jgi:hypothetical protein